MTVEVTGLVGIYARWLTTGDIPALPIRPAMRLRIGHALIPAAPATSADIGHPRTCSGPRMVATAP